MVTRGITSQLEGMQAEKRAVARNSVFAAVGITALKILVGLATGSLGILSEAAHSGLDLIAAIITFFSVQVSDRPADADHQYGHGKVENFSAFIETGLLIVTCVWIVFEALRRLFFHHVEIESSMWAFLVLFLSMAVDWWRSRALRSTAERYESQALEADALHFGMDIWSSGVVVLGLFVVWLGRRFDVPELRLADPLAAIIVAGVIVSVSWRLARRTIDALLDAAPAGKRAEIIAALGDVNGLLDVERVRIRRAGNRYFADLSVGLGRNATLQHGEQMVREVTGAIQRILPDTDVVVRTVPRASGTENIFDRIRAVATRHNLMVHDVSVQDLNGRLHVEQHVELDERLPLRAAHDFVTSLEAEMREEVPEISSILTHIESEPATIEEGESGYFDPRLEKRLREIAREFAEVLDLHDVTLKKVRGKIYLSCHCTLADELPLSRVHDIATEMETRFKLALPELFKVLIHPEPQTDNRR
jgi:cation diffusion facilitator family transporter